ncbi:MAG TPA: hypothetical protein VG123_22295, partial [Streptosporangiaceae bacterium]|nr:hypothetical protein [Streptosporangiaceae bacterium]
CALSPGRPARRSIGARTRSRRPAEPGATATSTADHAVDGEAVVDAAYGEAVLEAIECSSSTA